MICLIQMILREGCAWFCYERERLHDVVCGVRGRAAQNQQRRVRFFINSSIHVCCRSDLCLSSPTWITFHCSSVLFMLSGTILRHRFTLRSIATSLVFVGLIHHQPPGQGRSTFCTTYAMSTSNNNNMNHQAGGKEASYPGALIFLHGLGDTPSGWKSLEKALPTYQPRLSQIKYVFPAAPVIPIGINGDMEMTVRSQKETNRPIVSIFSAWSCYMGSSHIFSHCHRRRHCCTQGWFDLYDWPIEVGAKDDPIGLQRSVTQIQDVVTRLREEDGIPPNKVVLGGFSQGGAVTMLTCYHPTMKGAADCGPYAGCVGLSAWLTLPDQVAGTMDGGDDKTFRQKTPLFWGHGSYDDKVLFTQQAFGVEKLERIGVDVTAKAYPVDHSAHPREIEEFASFLDNAIFGTVGEESSSTVDSQAPTEASARNDL